MNENSLDKSCKKCISKFFQNLCIVSFYVAKNQRKRVILPLITCYVYIIIMNQNTF